MSSLFSRNRIITLASSIALVASWHLLAAGMGSRQILPGPADTIEALARVTGEPGFWPSIGLTLLRGFYGFVIALASGLLVGVLSGLHPGAEAAFRPLLVTIRSVPVISVILLALIWFRIDHVPVFIGFLTMFPILSKNIYEGIRQTDRGLIEMARVYKVSDFRILTEIHLPSVMPFLLSGISTAAGFGWRAVIIGEVLSQPRYGIGSMMQEAQSFILVSELIAWTLIAVLFGYLFESLVLVAERRTVRWK